MHSKYLDRYSNHMQPAIREYIDQNRNCEDIAMAFLVASESNRPPIYIKGGLEDLGVLGGISTSQNIGTGKHITARSACLNDLVRLYGGHNPLVYR
jgi:hypothetical protein